MHFWMYLQAQVHLVKSTCVTVCTSGHTLIRDVQQHSQVQDRRSWRWIFGWIRINNKLCPVAHDSFLNSSTERRPQQLALSDIRWKTVQDPT